MTKPSLRSLAVIAALVLGPAMARGDNFLLFAEDWESGTIKWRSADGQPITLGTEAAVCSTQYQHEVIQSSSGRVFGTTAIPMMGGQKYCVTAWVRAGSGVRPYLGINKANAKGQITSPSDEHWLIGHSGTPNGYGGSVVAVTTDGAWHWYAAPFTLEAAGWPYVVLKDFVSSQGASGAGDFDDIQLYQGDCPSAATGDAHVACSGSTPVCSNGACVQCTAGQTGACSGAKGICDTTTNTCVGCLLAKDCTGGKVCDPASKTCVGCIDDGNCDGSTAHCDSATKTCVACTTSSHCKNPLQPVCTASRVCGCAAGSCPTTSPVCRENLCRPCALNSDCGGVTPVCDKSGACLGCSDDADCASSSAGKTCIKTGTNSCGCKADSACGTATSGRICDVARQTCVAGCNVGGNGCPTGLSCTAEAGKPGLCVQGCGTNTDCKAPTPWCVDLGAMRACIGCRDKNDCSGATRLCNATTHSCVACLADSDCGSATSGMICDAARFACVAGCRTGGNGCPAGTLCIVGVQGIGTCVATGGDMAGGPRDMAGQALDMGAGERDMSGQAVDLAGQVEDLAAPSPDFTGVTFDLKGADLVGGERDLRAPSGDAAPLEEFLRLSGGGGCSCRVSPVEPAGGPALIALGLLVVLAVRRRRGQ